MDIDCEANITVIDNNTAICDPTTEIHPDGKQDLIKSQPPTPLLSHRKVIGILVLLIMSFTAVAGFFIHHAATKGTTSSIQITRTKDGGIDGDGVATLIKTVEESERTDATSFDLGVELMALDGTIKTGVLHGNITYSSPAELTDAEIEATKEGGYNLVIYDEGSGTVENYIATCEGTHCDLAPEVEAELASEKELQASLIGASITVCRRHGDHWHCTTVTIVIIIL